MLVDQTPIGRTTRSNPASFVGVLEPIRKLFAAEPLARERKYTAGTFSFNSGNGRCPACSGNGFEHVEMQFLSDVYLRCAECNGKRYRTEVLDVKVALGRSEPKSIADVLEMTVADALVYFSELKEVRARLQPLVDVGLDYLTLGQPVPTLSGGEAQRLKLAGELVESGASRQRATLFLLDEPTTGLHFADIAKLVAALERLVDAGHSVLVIEHNLDVIDAADWLIDLGPEGGDAGGHVVAVGTPADIRASAASHTGRALLAHDAALVASATASRSKRSAATQGAAAPTETGLTGRTETAVTETGVREELPGGVGAQDVRRRSRRDAIPGGPGRLLARARLRQRRRGARARPERLSGNERRHRDRARARAQPAQRRPRDPARPASR